VEARPKRAAAVAATGGELHACFGGRWKTGDLELDGQDQKEPEASAMAGPGRLGYSSAKASPGR